CVATSLAFSFFFYSCGDHRDLHSFPTRRSSDLPNVEGDVIERRSVRAFRAAAVREDQERPRKLDEQQRRGARRLAAEHVDPDFSDRKSTRLNSSHVKISYAVFCLKKKK